MPKNQGDFGAVNDEKNVGQILICQIWNLFIDMTHEDVPLWLFGFPEFYIVLFENRGGVANAL